MTEQIDFWKGQFGDEYTDRNSGDINQIYLNELGISRSALNQEFLNDIPKTSRILEVGCNIGAQLKLLKEQGFSNLYGIEVNEKAIRMAKLDTDLDVIRGSGLDIPFKDGFFDLVFTSRVLIHIHPNDLIKILSEIYRVSNKFIWGFEYFSDSCTEIIYRGHSNCLWKNDFPKLFMDHFPDLTLVKIKKIKYVKSDNVDVMYMLKKNT